MGLLTIQFINIELEILVQQIDWLARLNTSIFFFSPLSPAEEPYGQTILALTKLACLEKTGSQVAQ